MLKIEQRHRDAAARFMSEATAASEANWFIKSYLSGENDDFPIVQAFARFEASLSGGWVAFADQEPPEKAIVIVTNNLEARDAYGRPSHIWLTSFWHKNVDGYSIFDEADRRVERLSHWRMAFALTAPPASAETGK